MLRVTMLPKSKSNGRKPKAKKSTRNWLELPSDLMVNILQRVGVADILENAQLVCTAWREICKDPAMWRVIHLEDYSDDPVECSDDPDQIPSVCKQMCKHAVDRSQGQLIDLTMVRFCDDELLQYVADRSSQLRRLEIVRYFGEKLSEAFKKLSLLEELSLVGVYITEEDIEAAGRYCPLLKTLKMNQNSYISWKDYDFYCNDHHHDDADYDDDMNMTTQNDVALAIGKNLPELTHLELIGYSMRNSGLQGILDGCCHLESLDLRQCYYVNLKADLGKRCHRQIKYLKLPHDSLEGYLRAYDIVDDSDDEYKGYSEYDEYKGYSDYDYTSYDDDDGGGGGGDNDDDDDGERLADLVMVREMMAFMDMFK